MAKNILLLTGSGIYGVLGNYIDAFEKEFLKLGYNTLVIDVEKPDYMDQYRRAVEHCPIYAVVDCQGVWDEIECESDIPGDAVKLHYFCDHPLYHFERLARTGADEVIVNIDREHVRYLRQYYPQFVRTAFIPLAGCGADRLIPYGEREMDILFTGSYWLPETPAWEDGRDFGDRLKAGICRRMLECSAKTVEQALREELERMQVTLSNREFAGILSELKDVESYVRRVNRDRVIRCLLAAGIKVSVYGEGWEDLQCEGRENLTMLDGNAETARRALGHAKIALNVMPGFKAGFQERIAAAMLSGAVAVTDVSEYIEEEFRDGNDIVLYRLEELEKLPQKIQALLREPKEAERIAETGRRKALESHTWEQRVRQMAALIEQYHGMEKMPAERDCSGAADSPNGDMPVCGQRLEIKNERERVSFSMWKISTALSREVNGLKELYNSGYVEAGDAVAFLDRLRAWQDEMNGLCGRRFFSGDNLSLFSGTLSGMLRTGEGFEQGMLLLLMTADSLLLRMEERVRAAESEEMLLGETSFYDMRNYEELLIKHMLHKYRDSEDPGHRLWMESVRKSGRVRSYPQQLYDKYEGTAVDIRYDDKRGMLYVMHHEKRLYYPCAYTPEEVYAEYGFCCVEQDEDSPHRYLDERFRVEEGAVVIDAGAAEGNFALAIVEQVKKLYLVECDAKWIPALEATFAPWREKVTIIAKMLGDRADETHTTIDEIAAGETIDMIKMDVEGAEAAALVGAAETLRQNTGIRCVIATYHAKGMEESVIQYLRERGFWTETTEGYLLYRNEAEALWDMELRHALVRAQKI